MEIFLLFIFFLHLLCTEANIWKRDFFEKKIRPILIESCYECHSAKSKSLKAGLLLDRKAGWERGGKNGAVIIPGEPNKSILMNALRYNNHDLQMPPSGKLNRTIIADFQKWISEGAHDPRDSTLEEVFAVGGLKAKSLEEGRKFWAFKPIKLSPLPVVQKDGWVKDDIDAFILKRIEEKGLEPSQKADPMTLLRRIFFDLTRSTSISRRIFSWRVHLRNPSNT